MKPEDYKRDAERYRWLREDAVCVNSLNVEVTPERPNGIDTFYSMETLDAAIDAAIAEGK